MNFMPLFLYAENCGMMAVLVKGAPDVPACMIDRYGKGVCVYWMGAEEKDPKEHGNLR